MKLNMRIKLCHAWLIQHWPAFPLTHWDRVTHICVSKLTIIGSDNGLSPGRRQAIIWTNAGILLTGSLGTNFSEILIEILTFLFKKMHLKISSAKWRPFCHGLNVLIRIMAIERPAHAAWPLSVVGVLQASFFTQGRACRKSPSP